MSTDRLVPKQYELFSSMFVFFLIFASFAGLGELGDGNAEVALVGAAVSTIIFGVAMVLIGQRVPAKWWGEAVLVAVIFFLIWWLMGSLTDVLGDGYVLAGAIYAIGAGLVSGVIYELFARLGR